MAKSSRSKWKKLHRRQRAQAEVKNTIKRVSKLHKKLELTAKGGISLVPPQDPETRFHFTNPEKNLRVPDPRREYNNDYRNDRTVVDFSKPLRLPPPSTNFYGKSDVNAPHPMTVQYETIDADAPIAGHAMTKADLERQIRKAQEAALRQEEEGTASPSPAEGNGAEVEEDDGPEEYVFGIEDSVPRKVSKKNDGDSTTAKKAVATSLKKKSKTSMKNSKVDILNEEADTEGKTKISSMNDNHKVNNVVVSTSGTSKVKKMGGMNGSSASRIVSSGSKAAKKKK